MKTTLLAATALMAGLGAAAAQESMESKLEKKLKSPFFSNAAWITDYDKAREESRKTGKIIFAFFTRSYAHCPPCHALETGALSSGEFKAFAKDYVLFCHITSHVQGAKHDDLLGQKGGQGFPHLVAMDSEGDVLAELEGPRSVQGFEEMMAKAREFVEFVHKAKAGDKEAKYKVLVHRLKMGSVSAEEAEKEAKEAGPLAREQEETIQSLLANASVMEVLKKIKDTASKLEAGKKFLEMKKSGKPAPSGEREVQAYWILMMEYAEDRKDAATYEQALGALKKKFGDNPQAQQFFKTKEETLEKLKEGK